MATTTVAGEMTAILRGEEDADRPNTEHGSPGWQAPIGDAGKGGAAESESMADPSDGTADTPPNRNVPDGCGQAHVCREFGPCGTYRESGECWNALRARRAAEAAKR